jgi:hypothetical protein
MNPFGDDGPKPLLRESNVRLLEEFGPSRNFIREALVFFVHIPLKKMTETKIAKRGHQTWVSNVNRLITAKDNEFLKISRTRYTPQGLALLAEAKSKIGAILFDDFYRMMQQAIHDREARDLIAYLFDLHTGLPTNELHTKGYDLWKALKIMSPMDVQKRYSSCNRIFHQAKKIGALVEEKKDPQSQVVQAQMVYYEKAFNSFFDLIPKIMENIIVCYNQEVKEKKEKKQRP